MSAEARQRLTCMDGDGGTGAAVVRVPAHGAERALAEAGRLLAGGRSVVVALELLRPPDVGTLDALARLALAARRGGATLEVQAPDVELRQLAALVGLGSVLGLEQSPAEPGPAGADPAGADPAAADARADCEADVGADAGGDRPADAGNRAAPSGQPQR
jgi:hypothetical protein